jgi:FMN reductase
MNEKPFVIGIGGTSRIGSTSERVLELSLRAAEAEGARVEMLSGSALELPAYAPGSSERCAKAQKLVALFRECDGIIVSSPAYHASISGLVKNALDYTEDLSGDARVYFDGCAAGLISCGADWQGCGNTLSALRAIAHSLRAWPTPMGAMVNTSSRIFDEQGNCLNPQVKAQVELVGAQVVQFATMRMSTAQHAGLAV